MAATSNLGYTGRGHKFSSLEVKDIRLADDGVQGPTISTGGDESLTIDAEGGTLTLDGDDGVVIIGQKTTVVNTAAFVGGGTDDITATLADSGTLYYLDNTASAAGDITITLPVPAAGDVGARYNFVVKSMGGPGNVVVNTTDGAAFAGFSGIVVEDIGPSPGVNDWETLQFIDNNIITFEAGPDAASIGDYLDITAVEAGQYMFRAFTFENSAIVPSS